MVFKVFIKSVKIKRGIVYGLIIGFILSFIIIIVTLLLTRFARNIIDCNLLMVESANSLFMILILLLTGFLPGLGYGLAAANIDKFFKPANQKIVREIYDENDLIMQEKHNALIEEKKRQVLQKIFIFNTTLFTAIVILLITAFVLSLAN